MSRYELNYMNIDAASEAIIDFLANNNVDSKDVQCIRLSIEEVLLKYLDRHNESKSFAVVTSKRLRSLVIELSIAGESYDPFSENEDGEATMLHVILEFVTTAVNVFCLQTELVELSSSLHMLDVEKLRTGD